MVTRAAISAALDRAARAFDGMMLSEIRVFTRAEPVFNTSTGEWSTPAETDLYEGPGYYKLAQARPVKTIDVGESMNIVREWRLRVPHDLTAPTPIPVFPVGADVEITANPHGPAMDGNFARIDDFLQATFAATPLYVITWYHPRDFQLPAPPP